MRSKPDKNKITAILQLDNNLPLSGDDEPIAYVWALKGELIEDLSQARESKYQQAQHKVI